MEIKYVIIKDRNKLRHIKSNWQHHYTMARDRGYSEKDIVECGMFLDNQMFILDCVDEKHLLKHRRAYVGNALNDYQDMKLVSWLKGRELETNLYYSKKVIGLREGD